MAEVGKQHRQITRTVRTTVTLTQKEYDPLLRKAAGAPDTATVEIENNYGGDVIVSWTETTYDDGVPMPHDNEGNSD